MTTQTQTQHYAATSWAFMAKAEEALARGDLVQASRKGWYAAAWALRGFAREKGWSYSGFRRLYEVIDCVADSYGSTAAAELDCYFDSATALEMNSYEDSDSRLGVEICLDQVAQLLRKLEALPV